MSKQSTELGGMWQTNPTTGLRQRVDVGRHLGRLNAQARLTRLAVEQRWQREAEVLEVNARRGFMLVRAPELGPMYAERARTIRTRLAASQRARKVGGLAF